MLVLYHIPTFSCLVQCWKVKIASLQKEVSSGGDEQKFSPGIIWKWISRPTVEASLTGEKWEGERCLWICRTHHSEDSNSLSNDEAARLLPPPPPPLSPSIASRDGFRSRLRGQEKEPSSSEEGDPAEDVSELRAASEAGQLGDPARRCQRGLDQGKDGRKWPRFSHSLY